MRSTRGVLLALLLVAAVLLLMDTHGRPAQLVQAIQDSISDLRK